MAARVDTSGPAVLKVYTGSVVKVFNAESVEVRDNMVLAVANVNGRRGNPGRYAWPTRDVSIRWARHTEGDQ